MLHHVSINEDCERRLTVISKETGKTVDYLIELSVEEAALNYFNARPNDPVRETR